MMNIKRLVNPEGVLDHTALLPTKNKADIDFDSLNLTANKKEFLNCFIKI